MKTKAPALTMKSAVLFGLLATILALPAPLQGPQTNTTTTLSIADLNTNDRRADLGGLGDLGDLGADGAAAGDAAGTDAAGAASGSSASSSASDAHLGASGSSGSTPDAGSGGNDASDVHLGTGSDAGSDAGSDGSDVSMTDIDDEIDDDSDASTPNAQQLGQQLEQEEHTAISTDTAADDGGYADAFAANYHDNAAQGPFNKLVTDSTEEWLADVAPGFDVHFQDNTMVQYRIWANGFTTDEQSVFEAYIHPSSGTMYVTRMYRTGEESNTIYPSSMTKDDRLPTFQHMFQAWKKNGQSQPLKNVIAANIANKQTIGFLETLESESIQGTTAGEEDADGDLIVSYTGTKTQDSTDPNWQNFMASVGPSSTLKMVAAHHDDPDIANHQITDVAWKFGPDGLYFFDDNLPLEDNFIVAHLG
jgi:hypothetical protein